MLLDCHGKLGAFCNNFDLHSAIIGLDNQFSVFMRVAVLHRFYCNDCFSGQNGSGLSREAWSILQ